MNASIPRQDIVDAFCQDEQNLHRVMYIEDVDAFAIYQDDKGYFKLQNQKHFEKFIYDYLKTVVRKDITKNMVLDFIEQLKWNIHKKIENLVSHYIALSDCILDTRDFSVRPFDVALPVFFNLNFSATEFKTLPPTPEIFQNFLDTVLVTPDMKPDKELQAFVQEAFGYLLLPTLERHVMFFFIGSGRNGKSVLLNLLYEMVGKDYVTTENIERLTTNRFVTANLVGKRVNICNEDESEYIKSDRFKALVSGEPLSAERKFGASFSFSPTCKYIFAVNESPKFSGINDGLIERIMMVNFNRKIEESKRDTGLTEKLKEHLPGIIGWSLVGAKRLKDNGFKFTKAKQIDDARALFEENISSAIQFFREKYRLPDETNLGDMVFNEDMYERYVSWTAVVGKKPLSMSNFMKDINRILADKPSEVAWNPDAGKSQRGRRLVNNTEAV